MKNEMEQEVYINSEILAFQIASILNKEEEKEVTKELVYQTVKSYVKDEKLIDEVYQATINLLNENYNISMNAEKNVGI